MCIFISQFRLIVHQAILQTALPINATSVERAPTNHALLRSVVTRETHSVTLKRKEMNYNCKAPIHPWFHISG